ncbi:hypothetical protein QJS04_geneDACA014627 [Acorus gramineus]|uniref:IQ domain-containing protein IQM2-like n=1 Tax=Acorus gramineus TaxID=55184 RepID=A0AAV9ATG6_ACOGR|nr:hypothetical protein QJS04_geneDACA014627 [Acorus gramineus]
MGITFSCPGSDYDSLEEHVEAMSFKGDDVQTTIRSVSFKGCDSEPTIIKALSGKMLIEGSVSFKSTESDPFQVETTISISSPTSDKKFVRSISFKRVESGRLKVDSPKGGIWETPPMLEATSDPLKETIGDPTSHEAAVKVQKVYKSFRTRRKLADCAVLVEQRWWKLLDFAMLKRSSVSFFDIQKPETAFSRWSRAMTRAAKVGKGLSKDEKARKLALQHWLEAIDPRHRYGHNLHFYYDNWFHCESRQPFFYWLDVGEGKEVNLEEQCPRPKLQQQCIKYLGPKEREAYEVIVEGGKLIYKQTRELMDTSQTQKQSKWIFVLSTSKKLYVGQKKKGTFQHSSFLAGGATSAAGRLVVENGILKAVWPHSGHYRPTEENFQEFVSFLKENNLDLRDIKRSPTEEDEELPLRSNSSELDLTRIDTDDVEWCTDLSQSHSFQRRRPCKIEVPERSIAFERLETDHSPEPNDTQNEDYVSHKRNLFEEDHEETEEAAVAPDAILHRINSMKGVKSYQLGKQLSCKWTTGAGPRIGCVRDYPSEIQFRALEQMNLSPRNERYSSPRNPASPNPKSLTSPLSKENNGFSTLRDRCSTNM